MSEAGKEKVKIYTVFKISTADKKYLINIDFPEVSRIHLNPEMYNIDNRCRTGIKNPIDEESCMLQKKRQPVIW